MTTIAYRSGVLAADTLMTRGDSALVGIVKIAQGPDGRMGGACGSAAFMGQWLAWIKGEIDERPIPQWDDGRTDSGLLIHPDGKVELFEEGGSFEFCGAYLAMGSGRPEALGAMHAGASAENAVRAAIEHDCHSGGEVTVLRLPTKPRLVSAA